MESNALHLTKPSQEESLGDGESSQQCSKYVLDVWKGDIVNFFCGVGMAFFLEQPIHTSLVSR